jgi:hypothetical protein
MIPSKLLWLIVGGAMPLLPFGQVTPRTVPVPSDPLELASGPVQVVSTASRKPILDLLTRARNSYAIRKPGRGYDLKVSFTVDSQGQTDHDGTWELEDVFVPGQGLRWTAQSTTGYQVTGIASNGEQYTDGISSVIPLRLEEVRGILLHPLPSTDYANRQSIRTTTATFHGAALTCILLSSSKTPESPAIGRGWDESEECIDPQSGLLQTHSEAPGRYIVYDYTNAPQLGDSKLPRTVTITEGGRIVSTISVDTLHEISGVDPSRFAATEAMKARGQSTEMAPMTRVSRVHRRGPVTSAMIVRPVCVFGVVTPSGELVEAHSLQPSDPNSQAAIKDAMQINFSPATPQGAQPRQHFVFIIEKFISR